MTGPLPDLPVVFHDLMQWEFPLLIEIVRFADDVVIWEATVTGPGALLVPGLGRFEGDTYTRVTNGAGQVSTSSNRQ